VPTCTRNFEPRQSPPDKNNITGNNGLQWVSPGIKFPCFLQVSGNFRAFTKTCKRGYVRRGIFGGDWRMICGSTSLLGYRDSATLFCPTWERAVLGIYPPRKSFSGSQVSRVSRREVDEVTRRTEPIYTTRGIIQDCNKAPKAY